IYRIDYNSGVADAVVDLSGLRSQLTNPAAEVLNGIAYLPERDLFLVTGKYWDKAFLIRIMSN
ncbi:MAG: glutaminyl-peptide cyclotransferase, partial [Owenweeksia sp.]